MQGWTWELRASITEGITLRRASGGEDRFMRGSAWLGTQGRPGLPGWCVCAQPNSPWWNVWALRRRWAIYGHVILVYQLSRVHFINQSANIQAVRRPGRSSPLLCKCTVYLLPPSGVSVSEIEGSIPTIGIKAGSSWARSPRWWRAGGGDVRRRHAGGGRHKAAFVGSCDGMKLRPYVAFGGARSCCLGEAEAS